MGSARLFPLLLALLLSGCSGGAPTTPTSSPTGWAAWSGPYVELGHEYGFIGVGPDGYGPDGPGYVGVDRDGNVLAVRFQYKLGYGADAPEPFRLTFRNASEEKWRNVLEPLFRDGEIYGQSENPSPVRVTQVRAGTIAPGERDSALAALESAIARAGDPQPVGIADCGYTYVRTGGETVGLNCGQGDPGWEDAIEQMLLLREWVESA